MKNIYRLLSLLLFTFIYTTAHTQADSIFRPAFHFTPAANWMNDPNGLYYDKGVYHLFFQYYPGGNKWGPMHWGHATSKDLIRWKGQPIALYPDSLGYIFSGSIVVDKQNSSGLGKSGKTPIIALFTYHDIKAEKAGKKETQSQGLAYSLDNGVTWIKYDNNPVLKNPGLVDFRDPKIRWYDQSKQWIMSLATGDRIAFYTSHNLIKWTKQGEFGANTGAHGGVWECPDLLSFSFKGKEIWVLLVSINPGGPNGGSATQYFIGDFDGKKFIAKDSLQRWIDYGPDNYAGVTFHNTGSRKIFLGWMSNWQYGQEVPTTTWRSAMTVPRDLSIKEVNGQLYLASAFSPETRTLFMKSFVVSSAELMKGFGLTPTHGQFKLEMSQLPDNDFTIQLSNEDDLLVIGYDKKSNHYFIDRSKAGIVDFEKGFGRKQLAPRIAIDKNIKLTLFVDKTSIELLADDGLTAMTTIFFLKKPFISIKVEGITGTYSGKISYALSLDPK